MGAPALEQPLIRASSAAIHGAACCPAASSSTQVSEETAGEPLPEPCIAYILRQVLAALAYLHSQQRIHRDVKAANILLAADGAVKVSDFGASAQLR